MGLGVAGVDLLRSSRGPMVLEVNSSPGLEGIEGITGVDIAGAMVRQLESVVGSTLKVAKKKLNHKKHLK
jgi:ribosomal protein S6--L-glutamate ligase